MANPPAAAQPWLSSGLGVGKSTLLDERGAFHKNIKRVDHIAVAVSDLEGTLQYMTGTLGGTLEEQRVTRGPRTAMESAVVRLGDFTLVILRGLHPDSQVSRFVERYGPGVQHIAVEVFNIEDVVRFLNECGMRFRTRLYDCGKLKQVFTERNAETTMMFEFIERVDSDSFDERNIQRLYEDLEDGDLV